MIILCNVWCNGNSNENISLGLPEGDSWMPFAVDFTKICSIKLAGENDFLGNDKATIYTNNQHFTIDITFFDALKLWKTTEPR